MSLTPDARADLIGGTETERRHGHPHHTTTDITDDTDEGRVMPVLLTVPQTATLTGMSIRSTYRAIEADAIPHIRIGRRISIPTAKLLDQLGLPVDDITWTIE